MKTIELAKGIHSSALGFGCAPILGAVDAKKAKFALEVALECGINHFDLARSYGYGEAEQFVGQLMKGRRDKIVLASKFGIKANWKAALLRPVKPLLRAALASFKKHPSPNTEKKAVGQALIANNLHDRVPIRGKEMRKSLEQSLRALNTDYLDYFFIHEPTETLLYLDELFETANRLKAEGKIRALGLAYMRSKESLHRSYFDNFDLLQFDASPGANNYGKVVEERSNKPNVIFSPIRGGTIEMKPAEKLSKLFIDFPKSVILCSMFSEQHLRQNVALLK